MAVPGKKPMGANYWKEIAGRAPKVMRKEVRETLACPDDDAPLDWHKAEQEFTCPACNRKYLEQDGILSAMPSHDRYQLTSEELNELAKTRAGKESFVENPEEKFGALWDVALAELGELKDKLLLDPSCGTGWSLPIFAKRGAIVMGADPVAGKGALGDALKLREKSAEEFDLFQADGARLPFLEESIDAVFICRTLHTLRRPERLMIEVGRILKPEGVVVVLGEPMGGRGGDLISLDPRREGGQLSQRHYELIFREGGLRFETVFADGRHEASTLKSKLSHLWRKSSSLEPRLFVGRPIPRRKLPDIRLPWQRRYPDE